MSDFRKSKNTYNGAINLIKKGSKYDKDAKDIRDSKNAEIDIYAKAGKKKVPQSVRDNISRDADDWVTTNIKDEDRAYVKDMHRRRVREQARESNKASTGRKDFPFFKHTTKGK